MNIYIFEIVDIDNKQINVQIKARDYFQALSILRTNHNLMVEYKLVNELVPPEEKS